MPPKTLPELFKFYHDYVKPLYSGIQIRNALPHEVLFELNATLDHVSRMYTFGETEETAVSKAYSHLKRCCLDIFKLQVKEATKQFNELRRIDTSSLDNGDYDNRLMKLYNEIKISARIARQNEGDKRVDSGEEVHVFDFWQPVFDKCITFENEFYNHPKLDWASKRSKILKWKTFVLSIIASWIAGLLTKDYLVSFWKFFVNLFSKATP